MIDRFRVPGLSGSGIGASTEPQSIGILLVAQEECAISVPDQVASVFRVLNSYH